MSSTGLTPDAQNALVKALYTQGTSYQNKSPYAAGTSALGNYLLQKALMNQQQTPKVPVQQPTMVGAPNMPLAPPPISSGSPTSLPFGEDS